MVSSGDFVFEKMPKRPSLIYVTYSYEEGISNVLKIIAIASIFALICMIISLIIGLRKKDCVAILTSNIMVKTIAIFMYQILDNLLNLDDLFIVLLFFIATVIIEGCIYKKVLKYTKYSGMTVSVICNIATVAIIILMFLISSSRYRRLF